MTTRKAIGLGSAIAVLVPGVLLVLVLFSQSNRGGGEQPALPAVAPTPTVASVGNSIVVSKGSPAGQPAWSVAWSYDGKMLAASFGGFGDSTSIFKRDQDYVVRVWDADHFDQSPAVLKGHTHRVMGVAFSPDGKYLASGQEFGEGTALLWDVHDLKAPPVVLSDTSFPETGSLYLAFSPDSHWLAGTGGRFVNNEIGLWNMQDPAAQSIGLYPPEVDGLNDVYWFPDGQTVVAGGSDGRVRFWKVSEPQATPTTLQDNNQPVFGVALSRDGARLAGVGQEDGDLRLWDLRHPEQAPIALKGAQGNITGLDFSPDGNLLAASTRTDPNPQNPILLWDLRQPDAMPAVLRGHGGPVEDVAFSPDGKRLASASQDNTVRVWKVEEIERTK